MKTLTHKKWIYRLPQYVWHTIEMTDDSIEYHESMISLLKYQQRQKELNTLPNLSEGQQNELIEAVQAFSDDQTWKTFVREKRVIHNVFTILDECYYALRQIDITGYVIGKFKSEKWQDFVVDVMRETFETGKFIDRDGGFNDFVDTASGCDELLWNVASSLLAPERIAAVLIKKLKDLHLLHVINLML